MRKITHCLGTKLDLGTKLASFEKFWTWLALVKTSGYISGIYPFNFYALFVLLFFYNLVCKVYFASIIFWTLFSLVLTGFVVYNDAVWFLKCQELIKISQYVILMVVLWQYHLIVKFFLMKSVWHKCPQVCLGLGPWPTLTPRYSLWPQPLYPRPGPRPTRAIGPGPRPT